MLNEKQQLKSCLKVGGRPDYSQFVTKGRKKPILIDENDLSEN